jgi:hypothetical protein
MAQSMALARQITGRDEGVTGWAEPLMASPRTAKPCLKKHEKNKQGLRFFRGKPRVCSVICEQQEIASSSYLNRGKASAPYESHFTRFSLREAVRMSSQYSTILHDYG